MCPWSLQKRNDIIMMALFIFSSHPAWLTHSTMMMTRRHGAPSLWLLQIDTSIIFTQLISHKKPNYLHRHHHPHPPIHMYAYILSSLKYLFPFFQKKLRHNTGKYISNYLPSHIHQRYGYPFYLFFFHQSVFPFVTVC